MVKFKIRRVKKNNINKVLKVAHDMGIKTQVRPAHFRQSVSDCLSSDLFTSDNLLGISCDLNDGMKSIIFFNVSNKTVNKIFNMALRTI